MWHCTINCYSSLKRLNMICKRQNSVRRRKLFVHLCTRYCFGDSYLFGLYEYALQLNLAFQRYVYKFRCVRKYEVEKDKYIAYPKDQIKSSKKNHKKSRKTVNEVHVRDISFISIWLCQSFVQTDYCTNSQSLTHISSTLDLSPENFGSLQTQRK